MGKQTHDAQMKVKKIPALTQAALLEVMTGVEDTLFEKIHCVIEEGKEKKDLNDVELLRSVFFAQLQGFYPNDVTVFADETSFVRAVEAARKNFNTVVERFCQEKQITRENLLQKYEPLYLAYLRLSEALLTQRFYLSRFEPSQKAKTQAEALNAAGDRLRVLKGHRAHAESRTPQPEDLTVQANEVANALVYMLKTQKGIGLADKECQFDSEIEPVCAITPLILKTLAALPTGYAIDLNKAKDKNQACLDEAAAHQKTIMQVRSTLSSKSPDALIRPTIKALRSHQEKWARRACDAKGTLDECHLPDLSQFSAKLEKIGIADIKAMSDGVIAELNANRPLISYLAANDSPTNVACQAIAAQIALLEQAFNQYLQPFAKLKGKYDRYATAKMECETWLNNLNRQVDISRVATEQAVSTYEQACFDLANTHYGLTEFLKPTKFKFLRLFGKCCVIPEPLNSDPAPTLNQVSRDHLGTVSMHSKPYGSGSTIQIEELNAFNGMLEESSSEEEGRQSPILLPRTQAKLNPRGLMSSPSEELSLLNPPVSLSFRRAFGKPY